MLLSIIHAGSGLTTIRRYDCWTDCSAYHAESSLMKLSGACNFVGCTGTSDSFGWLNSDTWVRVKRLILLLGCHIWNICPEDSTHGGDLAWRVYIGDL